jgi:AraC-like DNA-binding protein
VSGFEDAQLVALLENLKVDAARPVSSELFVRGIAQAIAVHLARNYIALTESSRASASALPGFKLRRITEWMTAHLAEEFSLAQVGDQAGMSEFHFNRLFKRATAVPPFLSVSASQRRKHSTLLSAGTERQSTASHAHCCATDLVPFNPRKLHFSSLAASSKPVRVRCSDHRHNPSRMTQNPCNRNRFPADIPFSGNRFDEGGRFADPRVGVRTR